MSNKPRAKKPYTGQQHAKVETHRLQAQDHVALAQIQASIVALHEAKMTLFSRIASKDWNYPAKAVLQFDPDYKTGQVSVTMLDVKSVNDNNSEEGQNHG